MWKLLIGFMVVLCLGACGEPPRQVPSSASLPTIPPVITRVPTRPPTPSPVPSPTPRPSPSPTPAPAPVSVSGTGTQIVEVDKWLGQALLHYRVSTGERQFEVVGFDDDGEQFWSIRQSRTFYIREMPHEGWSLVDQYRRTSRLQVFGDRSWEITFYPVADEYLRIFEAPGDITGAGDDVLFFRTPPGSRVDILRVERHDDEWLGFGIYPITVSDSGALRVSAFRSRGSGSRPEEIILAKGTIGVVVEATLDWHIEAVVR